MPIHFDFTGIDLERVYQKLIKAFLITEHDNNYDFAELVANDSAAKLLESEIKTLNRMKRERS